MLFAYASKCGMLYSQLLAAALQQFQRLKGVKTSAVPFTFWLELTLCEVIPLYTHIKHGVSLCVCLFLMMFVWLLFIYYKFV